MCCTYCRIVCIYNRRGRRSFHPVIILCPSKQLMLTSTNRNYLAEHRHIRLRNTWRWMHMRKINEIFKFGSFHIPQIRRRRSKFRIRLKDHRQLRIRKFAGRRSFYLNDNIFNSLYGITISRGYRLHCGEFVCILVLPIVYIKQIGG